MTSSGSHLTLLATAAALGALGAAAALAAHWIATRRGRHADRGRAADLRDLRSLLEATTRRLDGLEREGEERRRRRGAESGGKDAGDAGAPPRTIVTTAMTPSDDGAPPGPRPAAAGPATTAAPGAGAGAGAAPVPVVLICDPGQDLDDEMMLVMARHLVARRLVELRGVIANLSPSFARARLTRGTLDLLGLHRVPVGIGTDGGDAAGGHASDQFETTARSYIVHEDGEAARGLESGHRLLQALYAAASDVRYGEGGEVAGGGLTVVLTSSMKDMAIFVRDNPTLFASRTREVVVMGGCETAPPDAEVDVDGPLLPDSAHNNTFDPPAAAFLYARIQELGITLTVVSRHAAYAAKMPRSVYDDLALTGSSIGWRLRNTQRSSLDGLWRRACAQDPAARGGLPARCDRRWFIGTFCGGDDDPSRCSEDTAWDLVTGFMQYDTLALLAAVPSIREEHFAPAVLPPLAAPAEEAPSGADAAAEWRRRSTLSDSGHAAEAVAANLAAAAARERPPGGDGRTFRTARRRASLTAPPRPPVRRAVAPAASAPPPAPFGRGTRNLIGVSAAEHSLRDPARLVQMLETGYRRGILCDHHTQPHIVLHLQLRWDNLADTLLTCLMLRSLWDMRLASVLGVIVSVCPDDCAGRDARPPEGAGNGAAEGGDGDAGAAAGDAADPGADEARPADPSTLKALAESVRATLRSIGLSHVKFLVVDGDSMAEHRRQSTVAFRDLYESAPPIGVTLVLTATFTSVWPFAEGHPELFRNKTVRVVHTGGALIWPARWGWASIPSFEEEGHSSQSNLFEEDAAKVAAPMEDRPEEETKVTSEHILVPDPTAQNHRLDMNSAQLFYKRAQALSVPMVILSRHVAKECCIPRDFFDVLGSHGGEVGKRIYNNERDSLLNLWRCSCAPAGSSARGNLPERCDAQWYAENFCAGTMASSEEEVWQSVEAVNLYSPIALLAALPGETGGGGGYFQTLPFPVRSATHHVIGLTEEVPPCNVTNPGELRSLVLQSFLSAALANESAFGQDPPPGVPIRMDHERPGGDGRPPSGAPGAPPGPGPDRDDMWTFSEAARREIFSRTEAHTRKSVCRRETKRKFVSRTSASSAAPAAGDVSEDDNS